MNREHGRGKERRGEKRTLDRQDRQDRKAKDTKRRRGETGWKIIRSKDMLVASSSRSLIPSREILSLANSPGARTGSVSYSPFLLHAISSLGTRTNTHTIVCACASVCARVRVHTGVFHLKLSLRKVTIRFRQRSAFASTTCQPASQPFFPAAFHRTTMCQCRVFAGIEMRRNFVIGQPF